MLEKRIISVNKCMHGYYCPQEIREAGTFHILSIEEHIFLLKSGDSSDKSFDCVCHEEHRQLQKT